MHLSDIEYGHQPKVCAGARADFVCLFEDLRPGQQFSSHFVTASWAEPVLSNGGEVSCSRIQHRAPVEDRTHDLAITSPTLS